MPGLNRSVHARCVRGGDRDRDRGRGEAGRRQLGAGWVAADGPQVVDKTCYSLFLPCT